MNIKHLLYKIHGRATILLNEFKNRTHLYDSEEKLAFDSQNYWNQDYSEKPNLAQDAHWKDKGIFEDQQRWLNIGKEHLDLVLSYSALLNISFPVKQIVEWGCGGGANAIHFARLTEKYIGVDITSESLIECNKQLLECGLSNFYPILIDASAPESVLSHQITDVDLFICTYVYELLPSPAYGLKVLKLANKMLKHGGIALVQIRYNDSRKDLKPKRTGYKFNAYHMTSYTIEEFWETSVECGFEPIGVFLKPRQPLVNDFCYAYYFLKKKNGI
jgi:SAM-dependent methyltransferase